MSFTAETCRWLSGCLAGRVPFAVYRLPGGSVRLVSPEEGGDRFVVTPWCGRYDDGVSIGGVAPLQAMEVCDTSTDRDDYLSSVAAIVANLRERGGKTVYSRVVSGDASVIDWVGAADRLFDRFPDAFCHMFYTPRTGAWLGATPEILLSADPYGHIETMALAGTLAGDAEWDEKNRLEHEMVRTFIAETFTSSGITPDIDETGELRYGHIKHLCTRIRATLPHGADCACLLDALSPTPAVAGLPRGVAVDEIGRYERHKRGCYAGYISVSDHEGLHAYVNLRCVHFDPHGRYCVYAGGGITADSDPETEWRETAAKAAPLLEIINLSTRGHE